jgi:hypothetical protein
MKTISYEMLMDLLKEIEPMPDIENMILKRYKIDDLMDLSIQQYTNAIELAKDVKSYRIGEL